MIIDQAQGGAFVGAGEVGVAVGVEGGGAGAGADGDGADLGGQGAGGALLLGGAFAGIGAAWAWAIWASEHSLRPASLPVRPGGRVVSIG